MVLLLCLSTACGASAAGPGAGTSTTTTAPGAPATDSSGAGGTATGTTPTGPSTASTVPAPPSAAPTSANKVLGTPVAKPLGAGYPNNGDTVGGTRASVRSFRIDGRNRRWVVFTPPGGGRGLPMVVFLHGTLAPVLDEADRDQLLPLVTAGKLSVVYPVGIDRAWDAGGGCCISSDQVSRDDAAFVRRVTTASVALVRPDESRLYLMGYSSGGKLAWDVACADPEPFAALATYASGPTTTCPADGRPASVLIGRGAQDLNEPVDGRATTGRGPHPSVQAITRVWLSRDDCPTASTANTVAGVERTTWRCADGTSVVDLIWPVDDHVLPHPPATPLAGSFGTLAWAFVSGTATPTAAPTAAPGASSS